MSNNKSFLNDKTYQKAKELLGRKKGRDLNKLNTNMAEAGLPAEATIEQKKAFSRGRDSAKHEK